jgi:signal transduction histidine kinase
MSPLRRVAGALPDTLFARIVLVLVVNLGLVWAVALLVVELEDRLGPIAVPYLADQIAASVQTLDSVSPGERNAVCRAMSVSGFVVWTFERGATQPERADATDALVGRLTDRVRARLAASGSAAPVIWPFVEPGVLPVEKASTRMIRLAIVLRDGTVAAFRIRLTSPSLRWYPMLGLAVAICLIVSLISLVSARAFSSRLAAFARASDSIGRTGEGTTLPESGPREIRLAAHAFNQMQERLQRFVRDRTQMLAAMSHDLRTPLTRMRLRAEFVDDETQRRKMLSDIAEMEAMITETMRFARDDAARERRRVERLDRMVEDICRTLRDAGHDAELVAGAAVSVELSPVAMRRALGNLLDNAIKYGHGARVAVEPRQEQIAIVIEDTGPGIPAALHEHVFQPFQRLDASRNRDTGGVGLGLSVARTIIRGHGGEIELDNRDAGGLRVTVTLPA